jgi:hypothetical protein
MSASGELIEKPVRPKSTLTQPIPYYPNLKNHVGGLTAAILMIYLESHYPAPQDPIKRGFDRISSLPVRLDSERICTDLQFNRRTLVITLSEISRWFPSEAARARAHGASREFIEPRHTRYGTLKPYSIAGPKNFRAPIRFNLRRNIPLMQAYMKSTTVSDSITSTQTSHREERGSSAPILTVSGLPNSGRIVELLERANVLAGDRRSVRYERLRAGVERGLVGKDAIKVKRKKSVSSQAADASD